MNWSPCPLCGLPLRPTSNGAQHPAMSEMEALGMELCMFSGNHIGSKLHDRWERYRSDTPEAVTLHMEVFKDGHPRFNTGGRGRPVTVDMINATLSYYRENSNV